MKKTTNALTLVATTALVCVGLTGCYDVTPLDDKSTKAPVDAPVETQSEPPEAQTEVEESAQQPQSAEKPMMVESPMATLSPEKYLAALEWDRLYPSPTWMMDTYLNEAGFTQEEKDWFFVKSGFNPGNNAYKEQASITGFKTWDYVYERLSGMGYTENEINYATSPEGGIKDYDPNVTYEGRR